jgi:hypothetical protein
LEFVVETDALNVGIGAVLMQSGHPISYFSKKLGPRLRASSTYIRELHSIAEAVHKWHQYLLGRFFVIRTDHCGIKELLLQQVVQTPDQQVYIRKLLGYQFRIEYKLGNTNKAADALSRVHEGFDEYSHSASIICLQFQSNPPFSFVTTLKHENISLPDLVQLHHQFIAGSLSIDYSVQDEILLFLSIVIMSVHNQL